MLRAVTGGYFLAGAKNGSLREKEVGPWKLQHGSKRKSHAGSGREGAFGVGAGSHERGTPRGKGNRGEKKGGVWCLSIKRRIKK